MTPSVRPPDAGECRLDPRTAGLGVEEHADAIAARPLLGGEIDDVPEQPAERGSR